MIKLNSMTLDQSLIINILSCIRSMENKLETLLIGVLLGKFDLHIIH